MKNNKTIVGDISVCLRIEHTITQHLNKAETQHKNKIVNNNRDLSTILQWTFSADLSRD